MIRKTFLFSMIFFDKIYDIDEYDKIINIAQ